VPPVSDNWDVEIDFKNLGFRFIQKKPLKPSKVPIFVSVFKFLRKKT